VVFVHTVTLKRDKRFSKRVRCQFMSLDGQSAPSTPERPALIVADFQMTPDTRFEWHSHSDHQLAWASRGVLVVLTESGSYVLPPTRALWIPAVTPHETRSSGTATMRSLYLRPAACPVRWSAPTPVSVTPLLGELITYLHEDGLAGEARARAEALVYDLLAEIPTATIELRLPSDSRAGAVAAALRAEPADPRTLAEWGRHVGASSRTLARLFLAETGLPFGRWRTLARLQAALEMLADGTPVKAVAAAVGYETTSAFVAAFRAETGITPGSYFRSSSLRVTDQPA